MFSFSRLSGLASLFLQPLPGSALKFGNVISNTFGAGDGNSLGEESELKSWGAVGGAGDGGGEEEEGAGLEGVGATLSAQSMSAGLHCK